MPLMKIEIKVLPNKIEDAKKINDIFKKNNVKPLYKSGKYYCPECDSEMKCKKESWNSLTTNHSGQYINRITEFNFICENYHEINDVFKDKVWDSWDSSDECSH